MHKCYKDSGLFDISRVFEMEKLMEFVPLYYGDRMQVVNPAGDVGVVTLWSKTDAAFDVFNGTGVDLSPETSRIAVFANLYGNGLPHMLRNLLHNPQIRHIVVCGKNLSGSREWLLNFFREGLEEVSFLGTSAFRIIGTDRIIDGEIRREHFARAPELIVFGDISSNETKAGVKAYFDRLEEASVEEFPRVDPPGIPEPTVTRFPAEALGQMIIRSTPDEAWRELIFRLYRFGHRNTVSKSSGPETRVELLNVHVVVENPQEESEEVLARSGFNLAKFRGYQERILDPVKPPDLGYTYGWLLRTGMEDIPVDSVEIIAERLAKEPESRHAFATLWNNRRHLPSGKGCPCFVSLFFRKFEDRLTMTATFRAHNAMDAWLENFYGLTAIQRFVADRAGLRVGSISVISHSISLDPSALDRAKRIADEKTTDVVWDPETGKLGPRFDPNGTFTVTFDKVTWELVVEHSFQGMKLGEYRGKTSEEVELQLSRDCALSIISHALYLGRELARKEMEMKSARSKS